MKLNLIHSKFAHNDIGYDNRIVFYYKSKLSGSILLYYPKLKIIFFDILIAPSQILIKLIKL